MDFDIHKTVRDSECELCPLSENCRTICNTSKNYGEKPLMIVSDYPTYEDDKNGTVMQSKKEQVLMKVLSDVIKADIDDIHFSYAVRCRPGDDNPPEKDHADICGEYLDEEILMIKPKVILTLGDFTMKALIGKSGITIHRGNIFNIEIDDFKSTVIPTFSPSFIERSDRNLKVFAEDVQKAYYKAIDKKIESSYAKVKTVTILEGVDELFKYVKEAQKCVFDFETTGLDTFASDFDVTGLAISFQIGYAYFIPLKHNERCFTDEEIDYILAGFADIMQDINIKKTAHNLKFDMHVCRALGINVFRGRLNDTMLMHHLLNEDKPHGLKEIVAETFPQFNGYEDEVKKYKWDEVPLRVLAPYAGTDADLTHRLELMFEIELLKDIKLYRIYRNQVMPANKALFWAEDEGMLVDRPFLEKAIVEADDIILEIQDKMLAHRKVKSFEIAERAIKNEEMIDKLTEEIRALERKAETAGTLRSISGRREKIRKLKSGEVTVYEGINLGSPLQLGRLLYQPHGFNFKMPYDRKKRKAAPVTAKDALEQLTDKSGFLDSLLLLRSIQKIVSTYFRGILDRLDSNNRVHTSFLLHGTETGRLSSSNPNLQNLPNVAKLSNETAIKIVGMVKQAFIVPRKHTINQLDFSQLELRIVGDFANDEEMIRAYQNNEDIHKVTGAKLAGVTLEEFKNLPEKEQKKYRGNAKPANFGLIYGQSADGYMAYAKSNYGVEMDLKSAEKDRTAFFKLYKRLPEYHATYIKKAKTYGYVRTLFGRKRRTPDINGRDKRLVGEDERIAVNSPIQGTGGELTLFVIALLKDRLDPRVKIVNTIHDSILPYIPDDIFDETVAMMKYTAENPPTLEYFKKELKYISLKVDLESSKYSWKKMEEVDLSQY